MKANVAVLVALQEAKKANITPLSYFFRAN
jgi:hypothetical protein